MTYEEVKSILDYLEISDDLDITDVRTIKNLGYPDGYIYKLTPNGIYKKRSEDSKFKECDFSEYDVFFIDYLDHDDNEDVIKYMTKHKRFLFKYIQKRLMG